MKKNRGVGRHHASFPWLYIVAVSVGLGLGMPGLVGWWPLLFVTLIPIFHGACRFNWRQMMTVGFLAGFLYHLFTLYWLVIVLGRYGGVPLYLCLVALILLAAYMGIYLAFFSGVMSWLVADSGSCSGKRGGAGLILVWLAPLLWVGLDWLRGWIFTGFPWLDLGYGLHSQPLLIQAADLGGHHLLTFTIVLLNALIWYFCFEYHAVQRVGIVVNRTLLLSLVLLPVALGVYSLYRYHTVSDRVVVMEKISVRVVQGNIDQAIKWQSAEAVITVETYQRLSRPQEHEEQPTLVVWPETALPFFLQRDPLAQEVGRLVEEEQVWLLTGAPFYELIPGEGEKKQDVLYYNSAVLLDPQATLTDRYNKHHLVPGGEYIPFRRLLSFVSPVVETAGDFTPGNDLTPLQGADVALGVLICFESIFADIARQQVVAGAELLVNITNDAWYGRSSAPYQTMAMAVLRAVENRRSLVRAANTGISGFVDPVGRVTMKSAIFEPIALQQPVALSSLDTVFGWRGHGFGVFCALFALLGTVLAKPAPRARSEFNGFTG